MTQRQIPGVQIRDLTTFTDDRGSISETYRREWFAASSNPGGNPLQSNATMSSKGVLRGLHFHHHQTDTWHVVSGKLFVALFDLRRSSDTFRVAQTLELDSSKTLLIPTGVAHGFQALEDTCLIYLVDQYYDASDEQGVAYDDPDLGIDWPIGDAIVSQRDQTNPRLSDIADSQLPD